MSMYMMMRRMSQDPDIAQHQLSPGVVWRVLRFAKHPITNGVAEGLNSKIMSIKRKAGGFRNPANFTTAIYFHCGGLDLYPRWIRKVQKGMREQVGLTSILMPKMTRPKSSAVPA